MLKYGKTVLSSVNGNPKVLQFISPQYSVMSMFMTYYTDFNRNIFFTSLAISGLATIEATEAAASVKKCSPMMLSFGTHCFLFKCH